MKKSSLRHFLFSPGKQEIPYQEYRQLRYYLVCRSHLKAIPTVHTTEESGSTRPSAPTSEGLIYFCAFQISVKSNYRAKNYDSHQGKECMHIPNANKRHGLRTSVKMPPPITIAQPMTIADEYFNNSSFG